MIRYQYFTLMVLMLFQGCSQIEAPERTSWPEQTVGNVALTHNLDNACVADYQPGMDYFPEKTSFTYSAQLRVEYGPNYKRVFFTPTVTTGEQLEYLFVQCGTPIPDHGPHVPVVEVPIQRLVTGNSSILAALDELGIVDRLYGSQNVRSATVPAVQARIEQGLISDMWGYGHASIEQAMSVQADVYLSFYSAYPAGNMHPRLWELGVRAIPQADHHETHPLGRAEWLKLLALMTNREAVANTHFDNIATAYLSLAERVKDVVERPTVMSGFAAGRDTFETFGAMNQRAQLIRDAGGDYALDENSASSLIYVPFEKIYAQAVDADVWLGTLGGRANTAGLITANQLHGWFRSAKQQKVYAWDKDYTGAWAYPYQDQSMTRPHIQLAEAIAVLHPNRISLRDDEFIFLRRLP